MAVIILGTLLSIPLLAGSPNSEDGATVLQCSAQEWRCSTGTITRRPADCSPWNPWSRGDPSCEYTSSGLDTVSLVTDAANYVTLPRRNTAVRTEFVTGTGASPWDLEPLPSGDLLWTTRDGHIKRLRDGEQQTIETIDVPYAKEIGLLGLAVHPEFRHNRHIYLYYTAQRTDRAALLGRTTLVYNRISRFTLTPAGLKNETVLLTVPGSAYHSGGRLEFGPDEKLYATAGDANMLFYALNTSFRGGKILRIDPDGTVPSDNPFNGSYVYSYGHRNPQGLAWHPGGQLYATEHGPWRHDEINRITPRANYGWPAYTCYDRGKLFQRVPPRYRDRDARSPVRCFRNWTLAPSGATFVNDTGHPWHGDLFVAGLRGKQVYRLSFSGRHPLSGEVFYVSHDTPKVSLRTRDIEYINGSLYLLGDEEGMVRIRPASES